jgi:hypothetical protein
MYNIQELSEEAGAAWNLVLELRQPAVGGCGLQERYFRTKEKCQSIAIVSTRYCSGNICIFLIRTISVSLVFAYIQTILQITVPSSPGDSAKNNMRTTNLSSNNDGSSHYDGSHRGGSGSASGSRSQMKAAKKVTISSTTAVAHETRENPMKKPMMSQTAPAQLHTHKK